MPTVASDPKTKLDQSVDKLAGQIVDQLESYALKKGLDHDELTRAIALELLRRTLGGSDLEGEVVGKLPDEDRRKLARETTLELFQRTDGVMIKAEIPPDVPDPITGAVATKGTRQSRDYISVDGKAYLDDPKLREKHNYFGVTHEEMTKLDRMLQEIGKTIGHDTHMTVRVAALRDTDHERFLVAVGGNQYYGASSATEHRAYVVFKDEESAERFMTAVRSDRDLVNTIFEAADPRFRGQVEFKPGSSKPAAVLDLYMENYKSTLG